MLLRSLFPALTILCISFSHAQRPEVSVAGSENGILEIRSTANNGKTFYKPPDKAPSCFITKGDSILRIFTLDAAERVPVIVVFKSHPLSISGAMGQELLKLRLQAATGRIQSEHDRFRTDLARIERQSASGLTQRQQSAAGSVIRYEYMVALNGVALTAGRYVTDEIRKLSYVQGVYEDKTVEALDNYSNALIGAPSFWAAYSTRGENIDIAILDTGIDYLQEALGGAPFPNTKVVGGYDIVNGDRDPMDDNGHGTHVAGIAAGDGPVPQSLKGVAYKARLWAFKVLNASGSGSYSQVLEGIERALDPDGNPLTPTPIKVLNMSLGGTGSPDDVLSQAVDNAAAGGIVCVIAAGNSGPLYQTIGSPGCARKALTVGACDNTDQIASFSSRGPTAGIFSLKPDIIAPGVQITSARMGGGYVAMSGTSMATPHVTGAAALLRQLHPDWTAEEIKAALMESAKDLSQEAWAQGSGRLDLPRAGRITAIITPGSLNIGLVDNSVAVWSHTDTLTIHNHNAGGVTFDFAAENPFPSGVLVAFNPPSATVPAEDSGRIIMTTTVDNSVYGYPATTPPSYVNRIIARSHDTTELLAVPFTFLKAPFMRIKFDEAPSYILIHDRASRYYVFGYPQYLFEGDSLLTIIPEGTYDVMALFRDLCHIVVKENIVHTGTTSVLVEKSSAVNAVNMRTFDASGSEVTFHDCSYIKTVVSRAKTNYGVGYENFGGSYKTVMYCSGISSDYAFFERIWSYPSFYSQIKEHYEITLAAQDGVSSDITLQNDPAKLKLVNLKYDVPDSISFVYAQRYLVEGLILSPMSFGPPFRLSVYYSPNPVRNLNWADDFQMVGTELVPGWDLVLPAIYSTGTVTVGAHDTLNVYHPEDEQNILYSTAASHLDVDLNSGTPMWLGRMMNFSSLIVLGTNHEHTYGYFLSPEGDMVHDNVPYELQSGGSLVQTGSVWNGLPNGTTPVLANTSAGEYTVEASWDRYTVDRLPGKETVSMSFNTSLSDKNPPYLKKFQLLSGGKISNIFSAPGSRNEVQFTVSDEYSEDTYGLKSVKLFYKLTGNGDVWSELPLSVQDSTYTCQMPDLMPSGCYSLRLAMDDLSGNIADYKIEPAFRSLLLSYSSLHLDVGPVSVGLSKTNDLMVTNSSSLPVTVTSVLLDNPEFAVNPSNALIPASGSQKFTFTMQPASPCAVYTARSIDLIP